MNAHDLIVDRILTALLANPALAGGSVLEEDQPPMAEAQTQQIVVRFLGSSPDRGEIKGAPVDWRTRVGIECSARRDERTASGRASRALHELAHGRLMADATLAGAALDILPPEISVDQAREDTEIGTCIGVYEIWHRTQENTLEAP